MQKTVSYVRRDIPSDAPSEQGFQGSDEDGRGDIFGKDFVILAVTSC